MHWGVSSSRKEDADKPHHLQAGGLCVNNMSVTALPVFVSADADVSSPRTLGATLWEWDLCDGV